jgi:preprotein translocase subunit SecD
VLYLLVFFTGNATTPKLGLDLRGGTTVTMQARTENGKAPSSDALNTAKKIIENRVNGLGVAGSEVVTEGNDRIVISVPGDDGEQAKSLGTTAQLYYRPALVGQAFAPYNPTPAKTSTAPSGSSSPKVSGTPSASTSKSSTPSSKPVGGLAPSSSASKTPATKSSAAVGNFAPPAKSSTPVKSSAPATSASPKSSASPAPTSIPATSAAAPAAPDTTGMPAALQKYAGKTCKQLAEINKAIKPTQPILSCTDDNTERWALGPSILAGTQVKTAQAQFGGSSGTSGWAVMIELKGKGQTIWAKYTQKNNCGGTCQAGAPAANFVGFVLDGVLIGPPPGIQGTINGTTQVSGNFDQTRATNLANDLKYGALPLSFKTFEAQTISPTLGSNYLRGGLIAGGIGLGLVVVYSLLYYRALGLVTIASLLVSGALVYACIVLLGQHLSLSLSLAGIAGFIVAVGITADSFVVLFERLKEEVHEGRSMRSGVPRAWSRARRTILTADAVSFLAAAILYYLAAGDVRGFAFTLGLSTILDLVVVFLFTHPLLSVLSRSKNFASPRFSGLRSLRVTPAPRAAIAGDVASPLTAAERAAARRARRTDGGS